MKYYTGIGSRSTPTSIIPKIQEIAKDLAQQGYILRSGNADGADTFFYESHIKYSNAYEIYLPWPNFNKIKNPEFIPLNKIPIEKIRQAEVIVEEIHPAWNNLKPSVRALHTRNAFQVLGLDLKTPSEILYCWTPNGEVVGGTATAIKIAQMYDVPIVNLYGN